MEHQSEMRRIQIYDESFKKKVSEEYLAGGISKNEEEMPLKIIDKLMSDCAKIDLRSIKEEYIKSKSKKV